jgi:galactitol-specific phosphotransferase system IIC component
MEAHARSAAFLGGMVAVFYVIIALIVRESMRDALFWGLLVGIAAFGVVAVVLALVKRSR